MDYDYDDGDGLPDDEYYFDDEEIVAVPDVTLSDLYSDCLVPSLRDGLRPAAVILVACLLLRTFVSTTSCGLSSPSPGTRFEAARWFSA